MLLELLTIIVFLFSGGVYHPAQANEFHQLRGTAFTPVCERKRQLC